jgi:4-hydroxybenzoate polyprenyltransferase
MRNPEQTRLHGATGATMIEAAITAFAPLGGYGRRMRLYLNEMYPIPSRLAVTALLFLGLSGLVRVIHDGHQERNWRITAIGVFGVFAIGLIARLMDELKDKHIDERLFPGRPLPSGRVLESDIRSSLAVSIALFITANLWAGAALWAALIVLAYASLMFRHFFLREMHERSLVFTLATHNPFCVAIYVYVVTLAIEEQCLGGGDLRIGAIALAVVMYWGMSLGLEIARKIRAPSQETEYVTYSRLWGPRRATLVAAGVQCITLGISLHFFAALSLSPLYLAIVLGAYAFAAWRYTRFILRPQPENARLVLPAAVIFGAVAFANALQVTVLG